MQAQHSVFSGNFPQDTLLPDKGKHQTQIKQIYKDVTFWNTIVQFDINLST